MLSKIQDKIQVKSQAGQDKQRWNWNYSQNQEIVELRNTLMYQKQGHNDNKCPIKLHRTTNKQQGTPRRVNQRLTRNRLTQLGSKP